MIYPRFVQNLSPSIYLRSHVLLPTVSIIINLSLLNSQQQEVGIQIHLHLPFATNLLLTVTASASQPLTFPSLTIPTTTMSSNDTAVTVMPTLSAYYFLEVRIGLPWFTVKLVLSTSTPTIRVLNADDARYCIPCRQNSHIGRPVSVRSWL